MVLRILQINTHDIGGGAEKVASDLHRAYRARGHEAWLMVGNKRGNASDVFTFYDRNSHLANHWRDAIQTRMQRWFGGQDTRVAQMAFRVGQLAEPRHAWNRWWGIEDFNFPRTRDLLKLTPQEPQVVHLHNLHGNYFDLRTLAHTSQQVPTLATLHDEWLFTGHCAYAIDCPRWERGCGQCPDLTIYPAVRRDATNFNWERKREIYRKSKLYVSTPSNWLMQRAQRSILQFVEGRVIHNGVDLSIFHPVEKLAARRKLDLPPGANIILHVAKPGKPSDYKDPDTIKQAVALLGHSDLGSKPLLMAILGSEGGEEQIGQTMVRHMPFQHDPAAVAQCYQAADIFVHAAWADTFPTTVLEALGCGTPVVATAVGGILEQIEDGVTGFLVPRGDHAAMASRLTHLLQDEGNLRHMGARAAATARRRFDLENQIDAYLGWYSEIIAAGPNVRKSSL